MPKLLYLTELTTLYHKELAHYAAFLSSTQRLNLALKSPEAGTRLSELLEEQGSIIANINDLDCQALELKTKLAALLGLEQFSLSSVADLPEYSELATVLQELGRILHQLEEVETENTVLLEERLKIANRKPQLASPKHSIRMAYRKNSDQDENSFDKKR